MKYMARKLTEKEQILEDLTICPGTGATKHVVSDCYPYWVTEVLPNHVYGICHARSHFDEDHPWEGGHEVIDKFDPAIDKMQFYLKRCYGHWWEVERDGKKRLRRFDGRYVSFTIGHACSYQNPSL